MLSEIGAVVDQLFYAGLLETDERTEEVRPLVALDPYPGRAFVVVDTSPLDSQDDAEGKSSRRNKKQAALAAEILQRGIGAGFQTVGYAAPFRAQVKLVEALIPQQSQDKILAATVHRFQGGQRQLIVFDSVVAGRGQGGTRMLGGGVDDLAGRLINVALSRARAKVVVLADVRTIRRRFARDSAIVRLVNLAAERGLVVKATEPAKG